MCGICLLIRQKISNAAGGVREHRTNGDAIPSSSSFTSAAAARNAPPPLPPPPAPSMRPIDQQMDTRPSALVPSSPDACILAPCTCSLPGLDVKSFLSSSDAVDSLFAELIHNLRRRGPDTYGMTRRSFVTSSGALADRHLSSLFCAKTYGTQRRNAGLSSSPLDDRYDSGQDDVVALRTEVAGVASVLGLRGHSTVAQPYDVNAATDVKDNGQANSWDDRSSLMWNGEIFGGALCPPPWGSDTVLLATQLSQMELECVRLTTYDAARMNSEESEEHRKSDLLPLVERQRIFLRKCTALFEQQVEGPYSFIFLATRLRLAVFGRDPLGRHSLLSHVRVTKPMTNSSGGRAVTTEELDVELIVSSVGVQHHHPGVCKDREEGHVDPLDPSPHTSSLTSPMLLAHRNNGKRKNKKREKNEKAVFSSSSLLSIVQKDTDSSSSGGRGDTPSSPQAGELPSAIPITSAKHGGHASSSKKRLRHEKRTAAAGAPSHNNTRLTKVSVKTNASTAEEDNEEAAGGEASTSGVEGPHAVCWQEVGVTGLFAVPLQAPLIYCDLDAFSTRKNPGVSEDGEATHTAAVTDQLHPVCISSSTTSASTGHTGTATLVCGAYVLLLHSPWQLTHHLIHPLLRTATLPMVPHEPPPFELILAHEEIAVLPEPLLRWASHLMKSVQPDGGFVQSWVDWAAAHYMLALAVSMHRRITVANSGAADGRDAQELSAARRRPLCILFSGGIDCTVIAALAHYILPVETPIELVNVSFGDNPADAPDRVAAFRSMEELLRLPLLCTSRSNTDATDVASFPEREWRLVLVDVPSKTTPNSAHIKDLLVPRHTVMDLDIGTALWYAAHASGRMQILKRSDVDGTAAVDADCFNDTPPMTATGSPTTAISSMSTSLHAVGVYGGNPTVTLDGFSKHFRTYAGDTPDTSFPSTTTASFTPSTNTPQAPEEVANTQKYQILVDVLVKEGCSGGGPMTPVLLSTLGKEYSLFLQPHIKRYGYKKLGSFLNDAAKAGYIIFVPNAPSKAVRLCRPADMERAAVVLRSPWFTTAYMKAQDHICNGSGALQPALPCPGSFYEAYTSHAKVVLLGIGADETLGGYTRYRRLFQREGMSGAQRELERDFARLWQRNLGRDDRVTMDSGREPRFPFLDEGVLRTLEWIVLKRRNNILATQEHRMIGAKDNGGGGVRTSSGGVALSDSPTSSLTHDELLRLALEPIVSFRLQPGTGDKRVLRRVACALGLTDVTTLQKRAIQFGSRIAERKIKGTTDF